MFDKDAILEKSDLSFHCGCFKCKKIIENKPIKTFEEYSKLLTDRLSSISENISYFLKNAQDFHDTLYTSTGESILLSDDIDFYNIVSFGKPTIKTIRIPYDVNRETEKHDLELILTSDGDGTVTLTSATIGGTTPREKTYRVNGVSHINLIKDKNILELVNNIINGKPFIYNDTKIDQISKK